MLRTSQPTAWHSSSVRTPLQVATFRLHAFPRYIKSGESLAEISRATLFGKTSQSSRPTVFFGEMKSTRIRCCSPLFIRLVVGSLGRTCDWSSNFIVNQGPAGDALDVRNPKWGFSDALTTLERKGEASRREKHSSTIPCGQGIINNGTLLFNVPYENLAQF